MTEKVEFWAKTTADGQPGISVRDHCLNVGCVAEALIAAMPERVRALLPTGAATLAALHDVGKITVGFQAECPSWLMRPGSPKVSRGDIALSISDHSLVSHVFLQRILSPAPVRLWAVAVGAHHGRPKGRNARLNAPEAVSAWAEAHRLELAVVLRDLFGPWPERPPNPGFASQHSDLWLLAGFITVAVRGGGPAASPATLPGVGFEEASRRWPEGRAPTAWRCSGVELAGQNCIANEIRFGEPDSRHPADFGCC